MNDVDGIYNPEDFARMTEHLDGRAPLMGLFWRIACDSGFRVSDILRLEVGWVKQGVIDITECKTKKRRSVELLPETMQVFRRYVERAGLSDGDVLFPVSRQYVWRVIRDAGCACGISCLCRVLILHARHTHGIICSVVAT